MKMSTDYYYATSDDYTEKKKSSSKLEKAVKRLVVIAAVIILAQFMWIYGINSFMPFATVEIHGFSNLNHAEILSLAGIDENSTFISANVKLIQERLASHNLVESAVVKKHFPDRLSIYLNPREAAAITLANIDSKQVPMYIDRNGVFFKIGESGSHEGLDLPVLSGIENPQLNMRLPSSLVSLVDNLNKMALTSPELLSAISEIRIERKTWDGFDLILFPVHSSIRVRVENNLTEDTIRYMLLMLSVFENDIQKPKEIDFRSGMGSYKLKEQSL